MSDLALITAIAQTVGAINGRVMFVGGYARDSVLRHRGKQIISKDIDVEVYGVPMGKLQTILATYGEINVVGASFGVIKLNNSNIDISIPRTDSKVGVGHKGFIVDTNPNMPVGEAARRRDFTINTIAIDVLTGEVIDEHGGLADIEAGLLRATDRQLFGDDPLRVLRAMQLAARFNLQLTSQTIELCKQIDLGDLPPERIGEEWKKLLLLAQQPSIGLEVAKATGILAKLHPELDILGSIVQDQRWHPEGSVWEHTKLAVDIASIIIRRDELNDKQSLELMLAVLCHDLGKTTTTVMQDGSITSYGHEDAGCQPASDFLLQLSLPQYFQKVIPLLVANHMFPILNQKPSDAALRRLAQRLYPSNIQQLLRIAEADILGRTTEVKQTDHLGLIAEQADRLNVALNRTTPLILGRDLIELGVPPGPVMGKLLDELFESQLAGSFTDHATGIEHVKRLLSSGDDSSEI